MYRKEMVKRLNEVMDSNSNNGTIVQKLTRAEKRILITNAIGDIHEKLCRANAFKRHFHATGSWLPITHLIRDENGNTNPNIETPEEEGQINIQHFKEYNYSEAVTAKTVHDAIDTAAADKAVAAAEERRCIAKRAKYDSEELVDMKPFIDKADKMMDDLTQKMLSYTETYLAIIHRETGLKNSDLGRLI